MAVFFLGVDVSKNSLSACLKDHSRENPLWTNRSVPNTEKGFALIVNTAVKAIAKVCEESFTVAIGMEATGVYGERIAYYFYENHSDIFSIYILNPMAVRSFAKSTMVKNKNDIVDANVIASYLSVATQKQIIHPWVVPPAEERFLNAMSKRREELIDILTGELNRLEKVKNQAKPSEVAIQSVLRSIEFINYEVKLIESEIELHLNRNPAIQRNVALMRTIPGIGKAPFSRPQLHR